MVGDVNYRGKMTDIIFVIRPSRREACGKLFLPETRKPPRRRVVAPGIVALARNREIARDGNFVGTPLSKLSQLCQFVNCHLVQASTCHRAIAIKLYMMQEMSIYNFETTITPESMKYNNFTQKKN